MQQRFNTRNYSVRDFEEWHEKGELLLQPKFQRRDVWSDKARSYLMDTIIRGKPIPKIYMRQDTNPTSRRTTREIVDGQQRLRTVLNFIKDGFKISKTHNAEYGGKFFSQLDKDTQRDILKYEFVVDLLEDMPNNDVYDVFARINTYSVSLKPQELRNAKWFGEFKTAVYTLSNEFTMFWEENEIFTSGQMLRMAEAEFVSEILIAMNDGIHASGKSIIDSYYKNWDDVLPNRKMLEKRFRETIDIIGAIFNGNLARSRFRAIRLLYPLICAIFSLKYGLPHFAVNTKAIKTSDYPKFRTALEEIDNLLENIEAAEEEHDDFKLSARERHFYDSYSEHWVHVDERNVMTKYIYNVLVKSLGA